MSQNQEHEERLMRGSPAVLLVLAKAGQTLDYIAHDHLPRTASE